MNGPDPFRRYRSLGRAGQISGDQCTCEELFLLSVEYGAYFLPSTHSPSRVFVTNVGHVAQRRHTIRCAKFVGTSGWQVALAPV